MLKRQDFWAITAYFNTAGWSSRLENYHLFRQALNIPLLTVEWSPHGDFRLGKGDADCLVQLAGGDLMWQKERLLNIALASLPDHVKYVAWLDCDLMFVEAHWSEQARGALQDHPFIQPFRDIHYLDDETTRLLAGSNHPPLQEIIRRSGLPLRHSFATLYERLGEGVVAQDLAIRFKRQNPFESYNVMLRPAYGHAWAARRDLLANIGFYDRCVLGGGDLFLCYGLIGKADALVANHLGIGWDYYTGGDSYQKWAEQASSSCRGMLASTNSTLAHLYHGELGNRQYKSRIDGLAAFGLDLDRDLSTSDGMPWSWARQRAELNAYFRQYMQNRREDG